jgi:hypothetical protein
MASGASIRSQIVAAVLARLEGINATGNYITSVGTGDIRVWRTTPFQFDDTPEISITDPDEEIEQYTGGIWTPKIDFEIFVAAGANLDLGSSDSSYNVAQYLKDVFADLTFALGVDRYWTVNGTRLAYDTVPGKNNVLLEQTEEIMGLGIFRFSVKYRMKSFSPNTLG